MPLTQNQQQAIRLIVILVIAGSGVIRWVWVKLQEQAAKKRAMDEMAQRRVESIRTGRNLEEVSVDASSSPSAPSPPPQQIPTRAQTESDAATRRQAQIEEFRRRQAERARQRSQVPTTPRPQPSRAEQPRPAPAPKKKFVTIVQTPEGEAFRVAPAKMAADAPQSPTDRPAALPAAAPIFATSRRPVSPQDWRRAIIASVILSPAPGSGEEGDPWRPIG